MNQQLSDRQKALVVRIARAVDDPVNDALRLWIAGLLEIRDSNLTTLQKAQRALALTAQKKIVAPIVKTIAREVKRVGWEERTATGRSGLLAAGVGLALFGGQSAGLAAFGTAIGVPLWVVFGAGAAFVAALYKELSGGREPRTSYRVVDAERED
jgi:hypothetical protein